MSEYIIVIAGDKTVFDIWCKEHNENPRNPKFVYIFDAIRMRGYRSNCKLLLLYGWTDKVREVPVWDDTGRHILEWVPNEMMVTLMETFMKPWAQILHEATMG